MVTTHRNQHVHFLSKRPVVADCERRYLGRLHAVVTDLDDDVLCYANAARKEKRRNGSAFRCQTFTLAQPARCGWRLPLNSYRTLQALIRMTHPKFVITAQNQPVIPIQYSSFVIACPHRRINGACELLKQRPISLLGE